MNRDYPFLEEEVTLIQEIREENRNLEQGNRGDSYTTAGRVGAIREHGGITFIDLWSGGQRLQVSMRESVLEDYGKTLQEIQRGDILRVDGETYVTRTGELTLEVRDYRVLTPCRRDFPPIGTELGSETRYRQRYLDLAVDPRSLRRFRRRSEIIQHIREYLNERGFIEVETPVLQPLYGGAVAEPFTTEVRDLEQEWYLRISPELYLKMLIVGGFERVYEIARDFRNESLDSTHSPEFTMIELYQAYADYEDMMELTENLIQSIAREVFGRLEFEFRGKTIDLSNFRRMTMAEALEREGIDVEELSDEELRQLVDENNLEVPEYNRGLMIQELFDHFCEDNLIQPTFITDHPQETTPLCRLHRENEELIERFELFVNGLEMANAYTEQNVPERQYEGFREQVEFGRSERIDYNYLRSLEYGLPPTGGLGIGIDRLVMLLTETNSIKDSILFPMIRRRPHDEVRKEFQENTDIDFQEIRGDRNDR